MSNQYLHRYFNLLTISLLIKTFVFPTFLENTAQAQTFEPPVGSPAPTITLGGGRRGGNGQCIKGQKTNLTDSQTKATLDQKLLPLIPNDRFGLTVSSSPKFFAYIPKTTAIAVEFTLENQQGKGIAHKKVDLTTSPSIVSVQFEKTPLEVGKDYRWLVSLICETGDPEDAFSEGVIRRIQPASQLLSKLTNASAIEQVYAYAKFGIWHDAIGNLATLQMSQPNNTELKTMWQDLLKSSNLESLANAPLKN
jgi:hypothetical protein